MKKDKKKIRIGNEKVRKKRVEQNGANGAKYALSSESGRKPKEKN